MTTHNATNERIKRQYFAYLKEAKRHSEATIDAVATALAQFEADTKHRDFKAFHVEQAMAFKRHLAQQRSARSGRPLSKATMYATVNHLKRFFQWLAGQPGYKSKMCYSDAEYFNLSDKDMRVATARREHRFPTIEQVKHVISLMPHENEIERRNKALVVFTLLTGARDSAIASMKLKHLDLSAGCVYQDAREVRTKFSKTFVTYFFPVGDEIHQILADWVAYLRQEKLWGDDAPLFPATQTVLGAANQFEATGLKHAHWSTAAPIRTIFRKSFIAAGLPYFNPHSFRSTLVRLGETVCQSPEEFKAWSQNLGHEQVLTTFCSYGAVADSRQGEIIKELAEEVPKERPDTEEIARAVVRELRRSEQVG
jgi:integrase